jgi:hypothetical protein
MQKLAVKPTIVTDWKIGTMVDTLKMTHMEMLIIFGVFGV